MPYRVDLRHANHDTLDRLIDLGAIDAEALDDGAVAALMPDRVPPEQLASALGINDMSISPAIGRDDGSVWVLRPQTIRIGSLRIVPAGTDAKPHDLRLIDSAAFGTGLHPTTALCLEVLEEAAQNDPPDAVLDVGTGSGVLALAALLMGVPRALGIDIDRDALRVAAENARINGMSDRLQLAHGGPESISGVWPLVFANVVAAPLIEMAPTLVRRVGHHGQLVLSGIPASVEQNVDDAYRRLGMQRVRTTSRAGWVTLVMRASW
ncbi:MAG TPA: 50S ribosomal protein L11 methyltransferase [Vicinamibacterales bacterium]|nr:50S ribosomal protein L11 methyltransferase [Vicinamibacterales bacterium]